MKKTLSLLLALVLLAAMTGCGIVPEFHSPTLSPEPPAAATVEPAPAPAQPATEATEAAPTQPAPAQTEPAAAATEPASADGAVTPLLWQVTDDRGHTLYLFGTIHAGDSRTEQALAYVRPVFDRCDALAVEFDAVAFEQDLAAAIQLMANSVYADGSTIRDHMPQDLYDRSVALLKEAGVYNQMLDMYKPSMWMQLTEQAAMSTRSKLQTDNAMDTLLIHAAYDANKPVLDVESARFQFDLLNNLPDETHYLLIRETLDALDTYGESLDSLYEAWVSGDEAEVTAQCFSEDAEEDAYTPEETALLESYNKQLLDDRNLGMAEKAKGYLADGQTVFFAVGTAHMVGDQGLVRLLRDAGYTVERITPGD